MSCFIDVQKKLDSCLQRDIEIKLGEKTIRRGSFILYTIKDFYLTVILKTPTSNKTYDILYPFELSINDDQIIFDYHVQKLICDKNDKLQDMLADAIDTASHKFLNKTLTLQFV